MEENVPTGRLSPVWRLVIAWQPHCRAICTASHVHISLRKWKNADYRPFDERERPVQVRLTKVNVSQTEYRPRCNKPSCFHWSQNVQKNIILHAMCMKICKMTWNQTRIPKHQSKSSAQFSAIHKLMIDDTILCPIFGNWLAHPYNALQYTELMQLCSHSLHWSMNVYLDHISWLYTYYALNSVF